MLTRRMRIAMACIAAVDNRPRPISTGVKGQSAGRVVGKPEVIQLDEKAPMLRLARPALQRLLPPGRQGASDLAHILDGPNSRRYAVDRG